VAAKSELVALLERQNQTLESRLQTPTRHARHSSPSADSLARTAHPTAPWSAESRASSTGAFSSSSPVATGRSSRKDTSPSFVSSPSLPLPPRQEGKADSVCAAETFSSMSNGLAVVSATCAELQSRVAVLTATVEGLRHGPGKRSNSQLGSNSSAALPQPGSARLEGEYDWDAAQQAMLTLFGWTKDMIEAGREQREHISLLAHNLRRIMADSEENQARAEQLESRRRELQKQVNDISFLYKIAKDGEEHLQHQVQELRVERATATEAAQAALKAATVTKGVHRQVNPTRSTGRRDSRAQTEVGGFSLSPSGFAAPTEPAATETFGASFPRSSANQASSVPQNSAPSSATWSMLKAPSSLKSGATHQQRATQTSREPRYSPAGRSSSHRASSTTPSRSARGDKLAQNNRRVLKHKSSPVVPRKARNPSTASPKVSPRTRAAAGSSAAAKQTDSHEASTTRAETSAVQVKLTAPLLCVSATFAEDAVARTPSPAKHHQPSAVPSSRSDKEGVAAAAVPSQQSASSEGAAVKQNEERSMPLSASSKAADNPPRPVSAAQGKPREAAPNSAPALLWRRPARRDIRSRPQSAPHTSRKRARARLTPPSSKVASPQSSSKKLRTLSASKLAAALSSRVAKPTADASSASRGQTNIKLPSEDHVARQSGEQDRDSQKRVAAWIALAR